MMEEVGLPNVGLMFDVLSAVNRKADPADYVYETGAALQKIHVCDYGRQIPGTQGLDFRQLFIALKDIGYDGPRRRGSRLFPQRPRRFVRPQVPWSI